MTLQKSLLVAASAAFAVFSLASSAQAQTAITTASIPLVKTSVPSTDLVDQNGQPVPVQQLEAYRAKGYDISQLNPATTQLWTPQAAPAATIDIADGATVQYDSLSTYKPGNFRFNAVAMTSGGKAVFQFTQSRILHDMLLRDALLRRLGYHLDPIKYVHRVRVNFNSTFEAEDFIDKLGSTTDGSRTRFIAEGSAEQLYLVLQDVVVSPAQFQNYNLAAGFVPASDFAGRRVLTSLIVPFALVQMPESVNLFSWEIGSIFNNSLQLDSESSDPNTGDSTFNSTLEDIQWMGRRIVALTRADFTAISQAAQLPTEVGMLVTEKLIARRNSLNRLLKLGAVDIPVNSDVSYGATLSHGKIVKVYDDNWPGYSARFAFGDPESPLSGSQKLLLARSQVQSAIIQTAVDQFNKSFLTFTNVNSALNKAASLRQFKDIQQLVNTGKITSSTYGVDVVPTASGQLILSRDIVMGSYLGSDNPVSLVDSIGVSMTAGAAFAVYGLPSPVAVNGGVTASVTRTYSHLSPVKSMKEALAQPFRKMLVPMVRNKLASYLDGILKLTPSQLQSPASQQTIHAALQQLRDNLQIGESLIITDMAGPSIQVNAGYTFAQQIGAYATFAGQQYVIGRTHILRSGDDTIQIYRDSGNAITLSLGLNVAAGATIVGIDATHFKGTVATKFYSVPLTDTPDATGLQELQGLSHAIRSGSLEMLQDAEKPYWLNSSIKADIANLSILFFRWKWQAQKDLLSIVAPTGDRRSFQRRVRGSRSGKDYEDFALDVATALVKAGLGKDIDINRIGNSDPGDTILGESQAHVVEYQAQIDNYDSQQHQGTPSDQFVIISDRYKGWVADKTRLGKIVDKINQKVGSQLIAPMALHDTTKLRLYNITLNYYIYDGAVDNLVANMSQLHKALLNAGMSEQSATALMNQVQKLKALAASSQFENYSTALMRAMNTLQKTLPTTDLINVIGSNNIFIYTQMDGFREGDEAGDQTFISSTLGQVGSRHALGPLTALRKRIGISESELFANWFLEEL